jgi:hypothetical protein
MNFAPLEPVPAVKLSAMRVFRTEHFPASKLTPWLDRPDWQAAVARRLADGGISAEQAALCTHWAEQGFVIIPGMFSAAELDATWRDYEAALATGVLKPQEEPSVRGNKALPDRVLNPHFNLPAFKTMLCDERVVALVSLLLGAKALPFQTIAGHKGSEQLAHSDSIHMTTYPEGYLAANWIAFEDIAAGSGPLGFYPGSHLLPYAYSKECGISLAEGRAGYGAYINKYEPYVQNQIAVNGLKPEYFMARKGDVLVWHANLLHGGSKIADAASSRKALVCHYFAEGAVCYHDYTGSPTHALNMPFLAEADFDPEGYLRRNKDVAAAGVDPYQHYVRHGFQEGRRDR